MKVFVKFMGERLELEDANIDTLSRIVIINDSLFSVLKRNGSVDEQFRVKFLLPEGGGKLIIDTDEDLIQAWEDHITKGYDKIEFEVDFRSDEAEDEAAKEILLEAFDSDADENQMQMKYMWWGGI